MQFDDHDSSAESEPEKDEQITGFGPSGYEWKDKNKDKGPLVIKSKPNRNIKDVMEKRRQQKLYQPQDDKRKQPIVEQKNKSSEEVDVVGAAKQEGGIVQQSATRVSKMVVTETHVQERERTEPTKENVNVKEQTDDEKAINALLHQSGEGTSKPDLVIPLKESDTKKKEEDAYYEDIQDLPNQPTEKDYEDVPVSEFGAAMLRGMTRREGQVAATSSYIPKARPDLLGLGAKPLDQAMGRDSKAVSDKEKAANRREAKKFVPVKRKEIGNGGDDNSRSSNGSSRRIRYTDDSADDTRSHRRHRSPSDDSYRDRDRQRDRDREKDRNRNRDKGRDKERERYSDMKKEKEKDHRDRDKYRDRERERSREKSDSRRQDKDSRYRSRHDYEHDRERRRDKDFKRERERYHDNRPDSSRRRSRSP